MRNHFNYPARKVKTNDRAVAMFTITLLFSTVQAIQDTHG